MTLVRPRPGLILAEVPADGAELSTELAETWIADQLVIPTDRIGGEVRRLGRLIRTEAPTAVVDEPAPAAVAAKPTPTRPRQRRQRRSRK